MPWDHYYFPLWQCVSSNKWLQAMTWTQKKSHWICLPGCIQEIFIVFLMTKGRDVGCISRIGQRVTGHFRICLSVIHDNFGDGSTPEPACYSFSFERTTGVRIFDSDFSVPTDKLYLYDLNCRIMAYHLSLHWLRQPYLTHFSFIPVHTILSILNRVATNFNPTLSLS